MAVRSVWGNMGYMGDSGWGRRAVERVRGAQEVPWSARNKGVSCCMHFSIDSQFGGIYPFLLLPSTKGQWRGADATVQSDQRGVEVLDGSL
jgi:hypothetical protein